MSKIYYVHKSTKYRVSLDELRGLSLDTRLAIREKFTTIATIQAPYEHTRMLSVHTCTVGEILHSIDWEIEDWDYKERLAFYELIHIDDLLYAEAQRLGYIQPIAVKVKKMLEAERIRIKSEANYTRMVEEE